jgi:hypothetical protein
MSRRLFFFVFLLMIFGKTISIAKAQTQYQVNWIRQFGSSASDSTRVISADNFGNVFLVGSTYGSLFGSSGSGSYTPIFVNCGPSGDLSSGRRFINDTGVYPIAADGHGNALAVGYSGVDNLLQKYDSSCTLLSNIDLGIAWSGNGGINAQCIDSQANAYFAGINYNSGQGDAWVRKFASSGSVTWTQQFGSPLEDEAQQVCVDSTGAVYVAGFTRGSLAGTFAGGSSDVFVAKLSNNGTLLWKKQLGSSGDESADGTTADKDGNVYVVGRTSGNLGGATRDENDAFVCKFSSAGNLAWTRHIGTTGVDYVFGVAVDSGGNVFVGGDTTGTLGTQNAGGYDAFIQEYAPDGSLITTTQFGTPENDSLVSISLDDVGNLYVGGSTQGDLSGTNAGGLDCFVARLSPAPEPSTLVLLCVCFLGLLACARRRT